MTPRELGSGMFTAFMLMLLLGMMGGLWSKWKGANQARIDAAGAVLADGDPIP